jgi:histone deacetylase 4/5
LYTILYYITGEGGSPESVGKGSGAGYTVNVGWNGSGMGDAEYAAVWKYVLMPIARAFNPDLIIVSAGFDAAAGDPLGGCHVTPQG